MKFSSHLAYLSAVILVSVLPDRDFSLLVSYYNYTSHYIKIVIVSQIKNNVSNVSAYSNLLALQSIVLTWFIIRSFFSHLFTISFFQQSNIVKLMQFFFTEFFLFIFHVVVVSLSTIYVTSWKINQAVDDF